MPGLVVSEYFQSVALAALPPLYCSQTAVLSMALKVKVNVCAHGGIASQQHLDIVKNNNNNGGTTIMQQ